MATGSKDVLLSVPGRETDRMDRACCWGVFHMLAIVAVACGITVVLSVLFRSRVNRRLSDVVSFQLLLGVS